MTAPPLLHIRAARSFDAGAIAALLTRLTGQNVTGDTLRDWLTADDIWHLAERDGDLLGLQRLDAGHEVSTFTAPDAQEVVIATRLFDATRKAAKARGIPRIRAVVARDNAAGLSYYQSRGFERLTRQPDADKVVLTLSP